MANHAHHVSNMAIPGDKRIGLAGHAIYETYSVLTRLPPPNRLTPKAVLLALQQDFDLMISKKPDSTSNLLYKFSSLGISGSSILDALVGSVASDHGIKLITSDLRASNTYRALDIEVELID
ncbi:MAG: VapC toxin family PIN domain ribonuclease [Acidimicrobiales bacterium]|nr:VapC toxin family PIN domain ribonuclease [Acidimicrobiales bacterium]